VWKLPRYLWCVKGNTQHKRAEFYWDTWNFKGPKQGRGVVLGPVEPEATQTGGQGSFIVPPGTWRDPDRGEGVSLVTPGTWRDPDRGGGVHWSPLEPKGTQTGVREFHWSPLEPEGTQIGAKGVVLPPAGTWRDPDEGQGSFIGPPWDLKEPRQGQGNFIGTYGTWRGPAKGRLWGRPDGMERERECREAMAMAAHAYLLPAAAQLSRFPAIFWHTWKLLSGLDKSRVSALLT